MGHLEIFTRDPWAHSAITESSSVIYSIDRIKLMQEVNNNLILRERFKLIEKEILYENKMISIFQVCYFCHKQHKFLDCPEKFPQFEIDTKNEKFLLKTENELIRYSRQKVSTLKEYRELESIRKFKMTDNYKMIVKVEKRLLKIRKKLNIRSREF